MRRQTCSPADVIVVEGVEPFHVALNDAASRVRTPFFVQVDADMILDPACFAALRSAVRPDVGIVTGALRDPLVGPFNGVKLFRRECFDAVQCKDTLALDSDFYTELADCGWLTVNVLAPADRVQHLGHTFGEHRPTYTPRYTYSTYYLLGRKYSLRPNGGARIRWLLERLRQSDEPVSLVARAAFGHGVFSGLIRDVSKESVTPPKGVLDAMFSGNGRVRAFPTSALEDVPQAVGGAFYELGHVLRLGHAYATFRKWMDTLARVRPHVSWAAEVGLAHGFLADSDRQRARVEARFRVLLPYSSRTTS